MTLAINEQAPDFTLPDTDGNEHSPYDAKATPDVFVLDSERRLRHRGAPDSDYEDPGRNAAWLREALDAVLDGRDPERAETRPVGCSIKWK
jgi:hypothetical protein